MTNFVRRTEVAWYQSSVRDGKVVKPRTATGEAIGT